jgi:hypothetical protein
MNPFDEYMDEYRRQMKTGSIQKAYRGLMEYLMELRSHFERKYPSCSVSGSLYPGYMDMTYFAFSPESLRSRKLKTAMVFMHDTCRFEIWLAGANRQVQAKHAKLLRESGWNKYRMPSPGKGVDAIVEHTLVENPDFGDLDALTKTIEKGTLAFIKDVERVLSRLRG